MIFMDAKFSRKLAEIIGIPKIQNFVYENCDYFWESIKKADTFDDLPDDIKNLLIEFSK